MPRTSRNSKETSFNLRIDPAPKVAFTAAEAEGKPAAQVVRDFMRAYVRQRQRRAFEADVSKRERKWLWPIFRISIQSSATNGLRLPSQVTIDRGVPLPRDNIGAIFGRVDDETMRRVSHALLIFLSLEDVSV